MSSPDRVDGCLQQLQDAPLDGAQVARLLALGVRRYAALAADEQAGAPLAPESLPTTTEVAVATSAMLEQVGIEVFELGLWRAWGPETAHRR